MGSVVIVPVAEELGFRGYLLRRLISENFDRVSPVPVYMAFFSCVFRGLRRGPWPLVGRDAGWNVLRMGDVPPRRGRIADAVIVHGVTNALIACEILIFRSWSPWI